MTTLRVIFDKTYGEVHLRAGGVQYMMKAEVMGLRKETIAGPAVESAPRVTEVQTNPSQLECEGHRASEHVPYAAWCERCVMGRGRDDAHRQRATEPEEQQVVE